MNIVESNVSFKGKLKKNGIVKMIKFYEVYGEEEVGVVEELKLV